MAWLVGERVDMELDKMKRFWDEGCREMVLVGEENVSEEFDNKMQRTLSLHTTKQKYFASQVLTCPFMSKTCFKLRKVVRTQVIDLFMVNSVFRS